MVESAVRAGILEIRSAPKCRKQRRTPTRVHSRRSRTAAYASNRALGGPAIVWFSSTVRDRRVGGAPRLIVVLDRAALLDRRFAPISPPIAAHPAGAGCPSVAELAALSGLGGGIAAV